MDSSGRLHMPGFVGQTFEETGVKKTKPVGNRKERKAREAQQATPKKFVKAK